MLSVKVCLLYTSGIVTELGGRTSHSAILARALEIPAVVAVNDFLNNVKNGDEIVLDGSDGTVYVNPESAVKEEYEKKREDVYKRQGIFSMAIHNRDKVVFHRVLLFVK